MVLIGENGVLTVTGAATFTQNSIVAGRHPGHRPGYPEQRLPGRGEARGAGAVIHTLSLTNVDATPGTLTFPASVTGDLTIDYVNASVSLGAVAVGGNMALTADGTIGETGVFTVTGTSSFDSSAGNGNVTLGSNNLFTGAVSFTTGTGNASLTNNRATILAASTIGGSLSVPTPRARSARPAC